MKNVEFFPVEFHEVKLGYNETEMNSCSPGYPEELFPTNKIIINSPQKIIYRFSDRDTIQPILPICMLWVVSEKRSLKYDSLSEKLIYISKIGNQDIYSSGIYDNNPDLQYEYPEPDPFAEELEQERLKLVQAAQEYTEDELEEGTDWGRFMNINLFDYIDTPIESGKYEIWMSFYGLESNHCIVEIVAE